MRKFIIIGISVGAAVAAGLLAGFTPQVEGPQMRRKAEMHIATAGPEDMPDPAPAARDNVPSWQVFGSVPAAGPMVAPNALPQVAYQTASLTPGESGAFSSSSASSPKNNAAGASGQLRVTFDDETVFLVVGEAIRQMEAQFNSENFDPLLHGGPDRAALAALAAPVPAGFGEALDSLGRPLRFAENRPTLEPECFVPEQPEVVETANVETARAESSGRSSEASLRAEQTARGEDGGVGVGTTDVNGANSANGIAGAGVVNGANGARASGANGAAGGEIGNWVVSGTRQAQAQAQSQVQASNQTSTSGYDRARRYREWVRQYAERYKLKEDLVLAIIHNESNFSSTLVSSKSAMGLMQILPGTAGGEIHKFIYGRTGSIGYAELSDPETNIRFGTAYLHLLMNRYLGDVENEKSREFCAIASYNMGPNRFLRLFNSNRDKAVEIINGMTPEEVYNHLTSMPIAETRSFVAKVTRTRGGFGGE